MINQFIYDGIRSYYDMGLIIVETPPIIFPERDISFDELPARSGSLINDAARWKNVEPEYKVAITDDKMTFDRACSELGNWLGSQSAYKVLTDTYDPDYYRMAVPVGAISITQKAKRLGLVTIHFAAQPFRYSFAGNKKQVLQGQGTIRIYNPESVSSRPIIRMEMPSSSSYRNVSITVNEKSFYAQIRGGEDHIVINSEDMTVYVETASGKENRILYYSGYEWPTLNPGWNTIEASTAAQRTIVTPLWRKL